MTELWIEVTTNENGVFISDWTHTMLSHWKHGHMREFNRLQKNFVTIAGKTHTYNVWTYGRTYEQCKAIAIWYHVNRTNGTLSKYRLD